MQNVKVRLLNDGTYPIKEGKNRTFPVISNGYTKSDTSSLVYVNGEDADALGFCNDGYSIPFYISGSDIEAEILE